MEDIVVNSKEKSNCKEYPSMIGRLNGFLAKWCCWLVTNSITGWAFIGGIKKNMGFDDLMSNELKDEPLRAVDEIYATKTETSSVNFPAENIEELLKIEVNTVPFKTISDYYNSYRDGETTPSDVCEKIIQLAMHEPIKGLNAIIEMKEEKIRKAAEDSTERYKNGSPLSIIDGIPFFIKDQMDVEGYQIYYGSPNIYTRQCTSTCTAVKRLLDAGAILMGTTNMTYAGTDVIGFNPSKLHRGVRNPYNTDYYCGGSSNGSAAIVACGLVPFSLGMDGLGSNRIPPAFTGMVGIRCTQYRVSLGGTIYEDSNSTTIGPITNNVRDNAVIYSIIAGGDQHYLKSLYQPSVIVPNFNSTVAELVSKIKIGYDSSLTHIASEPSIIVAVESTVNRLKDMGFTVVDYCIPEMHEINSATKIFFTKDLSKKIAQSLEGEKSHPKFDAVNTSIIYHIGQKITKDEYEQALKQRRRSQNIVKNMFNKFDILISPMTGVLAQKIIQGDDICGVLDEITTTRIILYSALSSSTGIPSITLQVDTVENNLPVAVQLQASWWNEHLLYELAHVIESFLSFEKRKPNILVSPF